MQPQQIRQHYRRLRSSLSDQDQRSNASRLAINIDNYLGPFNNYMIAAYLATQGEISLTPWIKRQVRHQIYLPKLFEQIEPNLRFAPLNQNTRWMKNRFNIPEPQSRWGETLHARRLDIMLIPLVAFDRYGSRMGMGAGYYDRALAFRRNRLHWKKPLLIGIAHSLQEHPELERNPWDIPMDCIITEQEIVYPSLFQK